MVLNENILKYYLQSIGWKKYKYEGIIDICVLGDTIFFKTPYYKNGNFIYNINTSLIYLMTEVNVSSYENYILTQRRKKIEKIREHGRFENNI